MCNELTYDSVAHVIAKKLRVYPESGKPHSQAARTIIEQLGIEDEDKTLATFQNNGDGHSGENTQYAEKVVSMVSDWLVMQGYPSDITANGKTYKAFYASNAM